MLQITASALFQSGEGSEQIQKSLRYNVHRNLGECFLAEKDHQRAEDHLFQATQVSIESDLSDSPCLCLC